MAVGDMVERDERPAYVQFETRTIEDKEASLREGHYVGKDVDYVKVTPPYSRDCYENKVSIWFDNLAKNVRDKRIPPQWEQMYKEAHQRWKQGQEIPLNGTPIKGWSLLSPSQEKMLISLNIRTIEDLAGVNEEGIRRIGMGAVELKSKAVAWLKESKEKGSVTQENATLVLENQQLKGTIASLQAKIERLEQQAVNLAEVNIETFKPHDEISAEDILEEEKPLIEVLKDEYRATFGKDPHQAMREKGIMKKLGYSEKKIKELVG